MEFVISKKVFLILFLFVSYSQIFTQNETIRSFTTGVFEVVNPQKAIIELGMNTAKYSTLYFNWLYSINDNIAINLDIRPEDGFEDYYMFLSASFNLTNDFAIGPYMIFNWRRLGLFGSYRADAFDVCIETKLGGDFDINPPPLQASNFKYFLSLSTKKRVSENLQLIAEIYFNNNTPNHDYVYINEALLFSIGAQYELFNSLSIRGMIGYNQLNNRLNGNSQDGVVGISYVFE